MRLHLYRMDVVGEQHHHYRFASHRYIREYSYHYQGALLRICAYPFFSVSAVASKPIPAQPVLMKLRMFW